MNKRIVIASASIAVIAVVASALLLLSLQNPRIVCYAEEDNTSSWYKTEKCPVLSSYSYGAGNHSALPNVDLGVRILNNNSISLFNVAIEVSYRTTGDTWETATRTDIGLLDIQQHKQTQITLTNPYLSMWQTRRPKYGGGATTWENVTVYFLNSSDYRIAAYGLEKP